MCSRRRPHALFINHYTSVGAHIPQDELSRRTWSPATFVTLLALFFHGILIPQKDIRSSDRIMSEIFQKRYQLVIKHRRSWLVINEADSSRSVGYQLKYVTLISSQLRRCLITFDIFLEIFPTLSPHALRTSPRALYAVCKCCISLLNTWAFILFSRAVVVGVRRSDQQEVDHSTGRRTMGWRMNPTIRSSSSTWCLYAEVFLWLKKVRVGGRKFLWLAREEARAMIQGNKMDIMVMMYTAVMLA